MQLADGSWRYLVVNHGGREAVEIFTCQPQLTPSRHCAGKLRFSADNTLINDVVGLRNGDVIYTRMYHRMICWGFARLAGAGQRRCLALEQGHRREAIAWHHGQPDQWPGNQCR